jgi:hypothetical protein
MSKGARFSLGEVFTISGVLEDLNDDGIPDRPAVAVVIGTKATPMEGLGAVYVAARLSLECMGLDPDLVITDDRVGELSADLDLIVVGTNNDVYRELSASTALGLHSIPSDHGCIEVVDADFRGRSVLLIAGRDSLSTFAAACHFATSPELGRSDVDHVLVRDTSLDGSPDAESSRSSETLCQVVSMSSSSSFPHGFARPPVGNLSLTSLFTLDGYLRDHNGDLIPDATNAMVVLPEAGTPEDWTIGANFAARLGLESGGICFPLAALDTELAGRNDLDQFGGLILIGSENILLQRLVNTTQSAESSITSPQALRIFPDPFGSGDVLAVVDSTNRGPLSAGSYLSFQMPYLSLKRRGAPTLDHVEAALTEVLSGTSTEGQAARAVLAIEDVWRDLRSLGSDIEKLDVVIHLDEVDSDIENVVEQRIAETIDFEVNVAVSSTRDAIAVFESRQEWAWEVSEFWEIFNNEILPELTPDAGVVSLQVLLSESWHIREAVKSEIERLLSERGFRRDTLDVQVLSAYKQGYSWISESVVPRLLGLQVESVRIAFQQFDPDPNARWIDIPVRWLEMTKPPGERRLLDIAEAVQELEDAGYDKWLGFPIRWLQELYPIDDMIAGQLDLARSNVHFEMRDQATTYTIEAFDDQGRVVFSEGFDTRWVKRPYLETFPNWGSVYVTTGWVTASQGEREIVSGRITSDLEKVWDHYQRSLFEIERFVLESTNRSPTPDLQPFFKELVFEVSASEPNERLGIREEIYSSLEALHEDLYFVTLDFFSALGDKYANKPLRAPGHIIPLIHNSPGSEPSSSISLKRFASDGPSIDITAKLVDGGVQNWRFCLRDDSEPTARITDLGLDLEDSDPSLHLRISVDPGTEGDFHADRIVGSLNSLLRHGAFRSSFTWPTVSSVALVEIRSGTKVVSSVAVRPAPLDHAQHDSAPGDTTSLQQLAIPLDRVIGYDENIELLQTLSQHPNAIVWEAGHSFQGRSIHALDLTLHTGTELWSQAKATIFKPTYHINCRHHANEVTGTNAAFILAKKSLTDPSYQEFLKKVNLCVVPFENADGAALHYELQKEHPYWMHHAARYNAAGLEFSSEYFNDATKFPEAKVRPLTWRVWLPDVVVDCHERPGHEWRQIFAGYTPVAWSYLWILPSLFTGILRYTDSEEYPMNLSVAEAMRKGVADAINGDEEIQQWNHEWKDRYEKYAHSWMPEKSPVQYFDDIQFHFSGLEPDSQATDLMQRNPHITAASFTTEVADETPQGAFLGLCSRAHLRANTAVIEMLVNSRYSVIRQREEIEGSNTKLALIRPRPVAPVRGNG